MNLSICQVVKLPIECMMDHNENLKLEIDLGWTIAGGADPIPWIQKYIQIKSSDVT